MSHSSTTSLFLFTAVITLFVNSAVGAQPPPNVVTSGGTSTAMGTGALASNTTGNGNTAAGFNALNANTAGTSNTAFGSSALFFNTITGGNSAFGFQALFSNTFGEANTAIGAAALHGNLTGRLNTALGVGALFSNSTGGRNTAVGPEALRNNTTGGSNIAIGANALFPSTGDSNTAVGTTALGALASGSSNIALGSMAGFNLASGDNNIDIGSQGVAGDVGTIRLGTAGTQMAAYIAGIAGTGVVGSPVSISANGQLGILPSAKRYKTAIEPMGSTSASLARLRPVIFRYKTDSTNTRQYGLIAEEVASVYPDLVIRDETGQIVSVRYDELVPMLLNEMQQQQRRLDLLESRLAAQAAEVAAKKAP